MASVERPLSARPTVGFGSTTADRALAISGGSTIHIGRSRIDGWCTLCSGRSVESHQCRRPAKRSRTAVVAHSGPSMARSAHRESYVRHSTVR
jgi:hypothetical protein